jgi:ankyrin repeat protein
MIMRLFIPDDTDEPDKPEGDELLFEAAEDGDVERVRERLAAGAAVDGRRDHRETALMIAAQHGHVEVFETLLDAGADPYLGWEPGPRSFSEGVLTVACRWGKADIVRKWIERGLDIHGGELNLIEPLEQAAGNGDVEIVRLLIDAGESRLDVPLAAAASSGHVEIIRLLIDAGADVNAEYSDRNTPLACALVNDEHEAASVLKEAGAIMHADCGYAKDIRSPDEAAEMEPVDFTAAADEPEFQELVGGFKNDFRYGGEWPIRESEELPGVWEIDASSPDTPQDLWLMQREILGKGYHLIRNNLPMPGGRVSLLLFPTDDKYAILASLHTNGENYGISDRQVRRWLRELEQKHRFDLLGAGIDFVDGRFTKSIRSPEKLAQHLYEFCPDIVDQGCGSVDALAEELTMTGRLVLWWD